MAATTTRQLLSIGLAVLVITSSFIPAIEARKIGGRKSSGSKSKPSGGSRPSTNYNPVSLSYPSSHSARPAPPKAPSAPQQPIGWNTNSGNNNQAGAANSRPIGWNVNNNNNNQGIQKATAPQQSNAAPPPYSPNFPPQQSHAAAGAPPPYSNVHPNGPPPAYSPQQPHYNPNQAYHPPQGSPPAYSPHAPAPGGVGYPQQPAYGGHGYQQPGYQQQPNYGHQQPGYPGGYPQQQYPGGGGGGFGGYPQPGGGFGGYGQQPVVNNYYQKGGGGNGLTNALLLGVGGLSLYSALKPGETKVIYINNSTSPEDARTVSQNGTHVLVSDNNNMTVATPLAPFPPDCSQYMGMPLPPQYFNQTAPVATNNNTSGGGTGEVLTTPTPLAAFPETTTMVVGQMETTTMIENSGNGTEAAAGETTTAMMTTMVAPAAAPGANETNPVYVPASMATNATTTPVNGPPVPIIPAECIPFMTGQVIPTNYTGPGPFVGAPANVNPVQAAPPQWPQSNPGTPPVQQQQQSAGLANIPAEGIQKSGSVSTYYAFSVTTFVVAFACSVL